MNVVSADFGNSGGIVSDETFAVVAIDKSVDGGTICSESLTVSVIVSLSSSLVSSSKLLVLFSEESESEQDSELEEVDSPVSAEISLEEVSSEDVCSDEEVSEV